MPDLGATEEFILKTIVGRKWLCVVVKWVENIAFVVTAYLGLPSPPMTALFCPARCRGGVILRAYPRSAPFLLRSHKGASP